MITYDDLEGWSRSILMEDSQVTLLGFNLFQLAMNHGQFHPWLDSAW